MNKYVYRFEHTFKIDDEQLQRLNKWRSLQDSRQLEKEKKQSGEPENLIMRVLWDRNLPYYSAISFYFSPSHLCTHVKVLYKSSGDIVDLTKDDNNEFLYDYNDDLSKKFFMGKEVTHKEILGIDY